MPTVNSIAQSAQQAELAKKKQNPSADFAGLLDTQASLDDEILNPGTPPVTKPDVPQNPNQPENKPDAAMERPSVAQFMALTGCDTKTAVASLYQYNNWQTYLKNDATVPDLETAQAQLQKEVKSGTRFGSTENYGVRNDFKKPAYVEPEVPGTIVPMYNNKTGELSAIGFVAPDGTQYTNTHYWDRETIVNHTEGFNLGHAALNTFAERVAGSGTTFDQLNLYNLPAMMPSQGQWESQYGQNSTWNPNDSNINNRQVVADQNQNSVAYLNNKANLNLLAWNL